MSDRKEGDIETDCPGAVAPGTVDNSDGRSAVVVLPEALAEFQAVDVRTAAAQDIDIDRVFMAGPSTPPVRR